ncbi:hypothetical protein QVD17_20309 [Tagetes erecta]|uniref:RNA-directed DNA polymerase, eukaryota n=1 Tax=Tagetes erecta TaxID=13708 RepID=A0AAD8NXS5_TARER|nr:hypothetical protein QVD17_20309 [Tagetes erecta]
MHATKTYKTIIKPYKFQLFSTIGKTDCNGKPDVVLARKLKSIKTEVKIWLENKRKLETDTLHNLKQQASCFEKLAEVGLLDLDDLQKYYECKKTILHIEDNKAKDAKQKARIKWSVDGDENTSFFHRTVSLQATSNRINGFSISGSWYSSPDQIKQEAFNFYKNMFSEPLQNRPLPGLKMNSTKSNIYGVGVDESQGFIHFNQPQISSSSSSLSATSANTPACLHYISAKHPSNSPIRLTFIMSAGRIQLPNSKFFRLSQSVVGWGIRVTTFF